MKRTQNSFSALPLIPALALCAALAGASASAQTSTPRANDVFAVNSGGGAVSGWAADSNFVLGSTYANTSQTVSLVNLPADDAPPSVYQDAREGSHFSYVFKGLKPSTTYQVTLHFAELYFSAPNQRKFDVTINGVAELTDFDIVAEAGGPFKAIAPQFFVNTDANGVIEVDFTRGAVDQPLVNALEVSTRLNG